MTIRLDITSNGISWYHDCENHNNYGPSFKWGDNNSAWWVNGKLHRLNGPAVDYTWGDGKKEWWINDVEYTYLEYLVAIEEIDANKEHT